MSGRWWSGCCWGRWWPWPGSITRSCGLGLRLISRNGPSTKKPTSRRGEPVGPPSASRRSKARSSETGRVSEVTVIVADAHELGVVLVLVVCHGIGPVGGVGDTGLELGLEPLPGRVQAPLDGADGGIERLGDLDQGLSLD